MTSTRGKATPMVLGPSSRNDRPCKSPYFNNAYFYQNTAIPLTNRPFQNSR